MVYQSVYPMNLCFAGLRLIVQVQLTGGKLKQRERTRRRIWKNKRQVNSMDTKDLFPTQGFPHMVLAVPKLCKSVLISLGSRFFVPLHTQKCIRMRPFCSCTSTGFRNDAFIVTTRESADV